MEPILGCDGPAAYNGLEVHYHLGRPNYPPDAINYIVDQIGIGIRNLIVDIGCGTGIFTRQIASVLPQTTTVIGVEPSHGMRVCALRLSTGFPNVHFRAGRAEALPIDDGAADAVTAATAAHWFTRSSFFDEVVRVLKHDGALIVLDNIPDGSGSFFLDEYEAYWEANISGYRRGMFAKPEGGFSDVDFCEEVHRDGRFSDVAFFATRWCERAAPSRLEARLLSSSNTKLLDTRLGADRVRDDLRSMVERHCLSDGTVEVAYITQVVSARRATCPGEHRGS